MVWQFGSLGCCMGDRNLKLGLPSHHAAASFPHRHRYFWCRLKCLLCFWVGVCFPTSYPIPVKDLLELGFCLLIHALSRLLSSINCQKKMEANDSTLERWLLTISILVDTDVAQVFFAREGKVEPCVHQFGAQIASPGRWPFLLWENRSGCS